MLTNENEYYNGKFADFEREITAGFDYEVEGSVQRALTTISDVLEKIDDCEAHALWISDNDGSGGQITLLYWLLNKDKDQNYIEQYSVSKKMAKTLRIASPVEEYVNYQNTNFGFFEIRLPQGDNQDNVADLLRIAAGKISQINPEQVIDLSLNNTSDDDAINRPVLRVYYSLV